MKHILTYLMIPVLIILTSGCSNLDFAGASVSDVTGIGDETPEYIDDKPEQQAKLRQERLAEMMVKWERQRQGLGGQDYMVGQDDVLSLSVFALQNPDEASEFTREVTKEGTIDLPLVGDLKVNGLTAAQIKKAVGDVYNEKFIRNPRVSVTVAEYKSSPVVISGAVNSPGVYFLTHNSSSVLELLSMADGLTDEAGSELMIVRTKAPSKADSADTPVSDVETPEEPQDTHDFSVFEEPEDEAVEGIVSTNSVAQDPDAPAAAEENLKEEEKKGGWGLFGRKKKDKEGGAKKNTEEPLNVDHEIVVEVDGNAITNTALADSGDTSADGEAEEDDSTQTIIVDLERLVDSGDLNQNVTITGGDLITIPTRKSEYVYIMGYVASPGSIEIEKGKRVRALWAIAQVGGLNSAARPQNCVLIRERNLKRIPVNLRSIARGSDPPLYMEPGDTLIVGSSSIMKLVEYIKPTVGAGVSASPVP